MACSTSTAPVRFVFVQKGSSPGQRCRFRCKAVEIPTASRQQIVKFDDTEFVIDDNPELKSNFKHRAIVASSASILVALTMHGWLHADSLPASALSAFLGYIFADIGSGIYHWGVDNYGSGATPIVGNQIAAFQGHHQRPWTITQREFCNNVALTFSPGGIAASVLLLCAVLGWTSAEFEVFASTSIFFICMSQQFHAWSHMKKSQLPELVVALQDSNLIISRKAHGAHHRAPFSCNYCIVNGWCNPILDNGFMHRAEKFIESAFGVEPRCWSDPTADWREQIPPEMQ